MVHRPSDSRLLSNLISHEKEYSKQLQALLDSSHASLASFSAFAAATAFPISQVILSVAGNLTTADDALRRYKDAVDAWREQLKVLKDLETSVSTIVRDREILVTRLLKASKNEKPPKDKANGAARRNSLSQGLHAPSSSSLSLSLDHSDKLTAARNELQACEAHLAEKEQELEVARITAIRDGLRIRCNALIDCGQSWVEMGKDGLRNTENLRVEEGDVGGSKNSRGPQPASALPHHIRAETESEHRYRLSSDLSSISPSQSASQVNECTDQYPTIIPNAPNPILGANGSDIQPESSYPPLQTTIPTSEPVAGPGFAPPLIQPIRSLSPFAVPQLNNITQIASTEQPTAEYAYDRIEILPAHAIKDNTIPTVTVTSSKPEATRTGSGYLTPVSDGDGSKTSLERPTGYLGAVVGEDSYDNCGENSGCSKEQKLIREGKLRVVENPRFRQDSVSQPLTTETVRGDEGVTEAPQAAPPIYGPPSEELHVSDVREIRQENELPEAPTVPPPGVPSSVPTGEPQTPKKLLKRAGSPSPHPSPHKSGLFGSLKKVFGGGQRREPSVTREEKAREREGKAKEKEERVREKEERVREKDEKARLRKRQKEFRERDRQRRLLVADSSDEGEIVDDTDSLKQHHRGGRARRFIGLGKKGESWASRTDRNLAELRRDSVDLPGGSTSSGYVMKKNAELEKNLRGGIIPGGHAATVDPRKGKIKTLSDTEGFEKRRPIGSTFVVEHGAKVTRSSSVPPTSTFSSSLQPTPGAGPSASHAVPSTSGTDTRFQENLNSPNGASHRSGVTAGHVKDKGYSSDTFVLASDRISGLPAAPAFVSPVTGAITVPSVRRKPSKRRTGMAQTDDEGIEMNQRATALSNATTPSGMSTGLSGKRGSVGVSVATPHMVTKTGYHRRAFSVDYGRGPVITTPVARGSTSRVSGYLATGTSGGDRESLMDIVDSVTRNNRRAWEAGTTESKLDRTRKTMKSDVGNTFWNSVPGRGSTTADMASGIPRRGWGTGSLGDGKGLNGVPPARGGVMSAHQRADRQSTVSSLGGSPGSHRIAQPQVDGTSGQKPLKSALRSSLQDSQLPVADQPKTSGYIRGLATHAGNGRVIPMEVLPSITSLPVEDRDAPPPVGRIRSLSNNFAEHRQGDYVEDDDDSTSTSSYETGHEDFEEDLQTRSQSDGIFLTTPAVRSGPRSEEDMDKNHSLGSPRSTPSPAMKAVSRGTPSPSPSPTPQRRKSVRVSLNPTFSPTPPAIEDEDDELDRAPFVFKEGEVPHKRQDTLNREFRTSPPLKQVEMAYGAQTATGKTAWDNDSDEDAEYQRAKSLLLRATRREKEAMGKQGRV